jgi:raffinose/stachyose/melibiose transport system substrate-binding protein
LMKRFLCLFLCILLSSCGRPKPPQKPPIHLWHWLADREDDLNALAAKYEKETGTKVVCDMFFPPNVYGDKIRAAAQTNTLPDIFGVLGGKTDFNRFISSGYLRDLTAEMTSAPNRWADRFYSAAFSSARVSQPSERYYGVPIDIATVQLVINDDELEAHSLSRPSTWRELEQTVEAWEKFHPGIGAFVCGFSETWLLNAFIDTLAINEMGFQGMVDSLKKDNPYSSPGWQAVFQHLTWLGRHMAKESVIDSNKQAEVRFANRESLLAFNGSWCINVYKSYSPKLQFSVLEWPHEPGKPITIFGGSATVFFVNAKSKHAAEAIAFLKWMTEPAQQKSFCLDKNNLPSSREVQISSSSGLPLQFSPLKKDTFHEYDIPEVESTNFRIFRAKDTQKLLIGEWDAEALTKDLNAARKNKNL